MGAVLREELRQPFRCPDSRIVLSPSDLAIMCEYAVCIANLAIMCAYAIQSDLAIIYQYANWSSQMQIG